MPRLLMLCKKPYRKGPQQFGCGQCLPCRINRQRVWCCRMMLEFLEWHDKGSETQFVTLTYNPENHPTDGSLDKRQLQLFLKRLDTEIRRNYPGRERPRYYAVGEYGEKTCRPHYHLILFGIRRSEIGMLQKLWSVRKGNKRESLGFIHLGHSMNVSVMQYCVSYIGKSMTKASDPRLENRAPEFALMSLRPGIGYASVQRLSDTLKRHPSVTAAALNQHVIRLPTDKGNKLFPMGRYLRTKLLENIGVDKQTKAEYLAANFFLAFDKDRGKSRAQLRDTYQAHVEQQSFKTRPKGDRPL